MFFWLSLGIYFCFNKFVGGFTSCLFSHPWRYFISSFAEGREIGGKKCIRSSGLWGAKPSCPNPTGVSTSMAFNAEDWSSRKKTCVEELAYSL